MNVHADRSSHPAPSSEGPYRVAVAGGGLVGTALGLALGRAGIPVAIIEADDGTEREPSAFAARPIALSQGSRRILDALGVWDAMVPAVTPITRIHVSDRGRFGFARLSAADHGVDALGYVLPAAVLARALSAAVESVDAVRLLRPAVVGNVIRDHHDEVRLVIGTAAGAADAPPRGISASLVVLCDGGRSPLRDRLGIRVRERDYDQWGITARVRARCPHQGVAYERFTPSGPLALLPMDGDHCGLVWSVDAHTAERLARLGDGDFLAALGRQFGTRLGGFLSTGPRGAFPLRRIVADAVVGERLAIIGNAAHSLHPVAGQGLNLGLRDAAALAEVIGESLREGGDPGDAAVLERYAGWRRRDQRIVSEATDALVRVFSNRFTPLAVLRDLGLLALDVFPPAKRRFGEHAMGLAGRQSRLTRGLAP